ncbi:hypothetical protein N2152v2_007696 [Parachlorella kessleri]
MLGKQCTVWPDPIAAAVYVPLVRQRVSSAQEPSLNRASLDDAVAHLQMFITRMAQQGACTLDVDLIVQDFDRDEDTFLYPFNAARNRALMLAETEALLLLDADFVPMPSLATALKAPQAFNTLMAQLRMPSVVVLPAFEVDKAASLKEQQKIAMAAVTRGKPYVAEGYKAGQIHMFAAHFEKGHNFTLYDRWVSADAPYTIQHEAGYEPYVLVSRQHVPWYDERFMGYGWDKIVFIMDLAGLGMPFQVHPDAFVMHMPHPTAPTYQATKNSGYRAKLFQLFREVFHGIRKKQFKPVVSFPHLCTDPDLRKHDRGAWEGSS